MFIAFRKFFDKVPKENEKKDGLGEMIPSLYQSGVKRVCSSLSILFSELEENGILQPWNFSKACKEKQFKKENKTSNCYDVIAALSGIVSIYSRLILQKQLLEPLLEAELIDCISCEKQVLELRDCEESCLCDARKNWYKGLDIDWLRAEIKTTMFISSYDKSHCDKMINTKLSDCKSTFLTDANLKEFTKYEQCVIEYLTHPHLFYIDGLVKGFIAEGVKKYKAEINSADVLAKTLIL